mgnify:CR=1 FL=1
MDWLLINKHNRPVLHFTGASWNGLFWGCPECDVLAFGAPRLRGCSFIALLYMRILVYGLRQLTYMFVNSLPICCEATQKGKVSYTFHWLYSVQALRCIPCSRHAQPPAPEFTL